MRSEDVITARIKPSEGDSDLYDIPNYLLPGPCKNFTAHLDRNFYTRITGLVKNRQIPQSQIGDYRLAAAVLAFCQLAEITFDYGASLQEYASNHSGDAAINELKAFHLADNTSASYFVDFALGRLNSIPEHAFSSIPEMEEIPSAKGLAQKTAEYPHNYAFMLKIAQLSKTKSEPWEKMMDMMEWMNSDFFFGSSAFLFANYYFSPRRYGKMLKNLSRAGIENAAWDLALVERWKKLALAGIGKNEPVLLITRDKAVKAIARTHFADSEQDALDFISKNWGRKNACGRLIAERYRELTAVIRSSGLGRRIIDKTNYAQIVAELEMQVFAD